MTNEETSLFENLKNEITQKNNVIDIGCGHGGLLLPFEEIGFKKLIGIGLDSRIEINYYEKKQKQENITYQESVLKYMDDQYLIYHGGDYRNFNFESMKYSFIISRYFLHFIQDQEKFKLIKLLYNQLEEKGIMYLKFNHIRNKDNTDSTLTNNLGDGVFEDRTGKTPKRYLVDPEEFLKKLYGLISKSIEKTVDEKAITLIIRKI